MKSGRGKRMRDQKRSGPLSCIVLMILMIISSFSLQLLFYFHQLPSPQTLLFKIRWTSITGKRQTTLFLVKKSFLTSAVSIMILMTDDMLMM